MSSRDVTGEFIGDVSGGIGTDDQPDRGPETPAKGDRAIALSRWALPALLVVFLVVFSVLRPDTYFTVNNFRTIAVTQAVLGILALAAVLPLVIGAFDVSIAANLGLSSILVTGLSAKSGLPAVVAIILAILVCTIIGLINGTIIGRLEINPFIVTLAMSTIISGLVLWYSNGTTIYENVPKLLHDIGFTRIIGVPLPVWILGVIALIAWYVTQHTPLGRYLYALGGSAEAARLSGLKVTGLTVLTFALAGMLAGIAGVVQAGELGVGNPTVGPDLLLPAFAAAFLGATAIRVGSFNVWGTIIAVYLLAAGVTGLEQVGVPSFVEPIFNGVALMVAVTVVHVLRRDADGA